MTTMARLPSIPIHKRARSISSTTASSSRTSCSSMSSPARSTSRTSISTTSSPRDDEHDDVKLDRQPDFLEKVCRRLPSRHLDDVSLRTGIEDAAADARKKPGRVGIRRQSSLPDFSNASSRKSKLTPTSIPSHVVVRRSSKGLPRRGTPEAGEYRLMMNSEASLEMSQVHALKALAKELARRSTLPEIVRRMALPVLRYNSVKAFPEQFLARFMCDTDEGERVPDATVRLLRLLAQEADLNFRDVAGQILWHFQTSRVFRGEPNLLEAVEDFSWIDAAQADPQAVDNITANVDLAFSGYAKVADGRMDERGYRKMMGQIFALYISEEGGALNCKGMQGAMYRHEFYHLFYRVARRTNRPDIDCAEFKVLLAHIADGLQVHPYKMFAVVATTKRPPPTPSSSSDC